MSPSEATALLAMMRGYWPRQAVTEEMICGYTEMLSDLAWDVAKLAVKELAATSQWWPAISEIRGVVARLRLDSIPAGDAWSEVMDAIRSVGRYRTPVFSSPAIQRAVDAVGGWMVLCDSEMIAAERKCFLAAYEDAARRDLREAQVCGILPTAEDRKRLARGESVHVGSLLRLGSGGEK